MGISQFLRKKAEEAINVILTNDSEEQEIEDAKGFFVSTNEDQPDSVIIIGAITKDNTIFFICQRIW